MDALDFFNAISLRADVGKTISRSFLHLVVPVEGGL
jgi:hypothetical protein